MWCNGRASRKDTPERISSNHLKYGLKSCIEHDYLLPVTADRSYVEDQYGVGWGSISIGDTIKSH